VNRADVEGALVVRDCWFRTIAENDQLSDAHGRCISTDTST